MSGCILGLYASHSPVFLVNSCLDLFSAPAPGGRDPFSRSYGVSLPSSLTMNLSSALVYSTRPPVSVCGTGVRDLRLRGFSWEYDYRRCQRTRGFAVLSAIGIAIRLNLRTRLTLIRLALIRKPWSCGGEVSRLPCRYLSLHVLFRARPHASRHTFAAARNAPLPTTLSTCGSTSSAPDLCPIIIHAGPLDR